MEGQIPLTFFKPIYGKNFDKLMYIPPNVAPLISELNGRKTYLNDSSSRKWEVSVSEVDGLLAFQQGWNDFFTGQGLEYGDFLVFLYTGTYFDVEVYDKNAIQRFKFQNSSQTKKRTQMDRQSSNPLNGFIDPTNIGSMKKEKSRKRNMESDEQGKKSRARPLHTRNDKSQLKRGNVNREKRKRPRFQDQSQSNSDLANTNGDTESFSLYCSRNDRFDSERNTVETDDFEETLPHFHSQEGQRQFKRGTNADRERPSLYRCCKDRSQSKRNAVEIDDFEKTTQFKRQNVETDGGDRENLSLYGGSKDGSESGRNSIEIDDFEETSQFKRHDVETEVGGRENSLPSCIKKAEIQPKREIFEDSFFGFAWEEVKNTHNEERTAVLDLSEFEVWGGCCTNQSAGIKAAAVRSGFGDKDQGTSSRDVRTNETSNCASEVAAKVEAVGEMFGYNSNSDAPVATKKEKGHILFEDHPREPTSGSAVPVIKKEQMGADALSFNLAKNKPTAQGAAFPVIKKEGMGADALRFNLTKNNPAASEVEGAGEVFGDKSKSDAPVATKEKGHILSGDHPREPSSVPVSAKKYPGHMMPADYQEYEYNKRVPLAVSGAPVPVIKKEQMGADALPFNTAKNKPTAQGAALSVIMKEEMRLDALRFNLTKEKPTISAKTEPKVETFTDWSLEPLRVMATNLSFLELPLELPGESETLQCSGVTQREVILQDSSKRMYSVNYNRNTTRKVLSRGWDKFCNANGVQLGDECIFHFIAKFVYAVSVVKKQSVTSSKDLILW